MRRGYLSCAVVLGIIGGLACGISSSVSAQPSSSSSSSSVSASSHYAAEAVPKALGPYEQACAWRDGMNGRVDAKLAFEQFSALALQGDPQAMREVGKCYYFGQGVRCDLYEAYTCFFKASYAHDLESYYWLARCYHEGSGTVKDAVQAKRWYEKAGRGGYVPDSLRFIGDEYFGTCVPKFTLNEKIDFAREAKYQLGQEICRGNALSAYKLATLYSTGLLGMKEPEKAAVLFSLAQRLWSGSILESEAARITKLVDSTQAQKTSSGQLPFQAQASGAFMPEELPAASRYYLAHFIFGRQAADAGLEPDLAQAEALMRSACSSGYLPAVLELAAELSTIKGADDVEVVTMLTQLAEHGHREAMWRLVSGGRLGAELPAAKANQYYSALAMAGDTKAIVSWVEAYLGNPASPEFNPAQALHWLHSAGNLGNYQACYLLSLIYDQGNISIPLRAYNVESLNEMQAQLNEAYAEQAQAKSGISLDSERARGNALLLLSRRKWTDEDQAQSLEWLERASRCSFGYDANYAGDLHVYTLLGNRLAFGRGCEANGGKACASYRVAVEQGRDEEAQYRLGLLLLKGKGDVTDYEQSVLEGKQILATLSQKGTPYWRNLAQELLRKTP